MKSFEPFLVSDELFDLSHLNAFYTEFIQPPKAGMSEKIYRCLIEFSHHCFTKSPNVHKGENLLDYPATLHYKTEKETRIFCLERYRLSVKLPEILRQMDQQKCFFTSAHDKFLTISLQDQHNQTVDYEIYFSLKKSPRYDVHIFINSAYTRSPDYNTYQPPPRRKSVSLFVLLHNTLHNKKIRRPL